MDEIDLWGDLLEITNRKTIVHNEAGEQLILDTEMYGDRPVLGKVIVVPMKLAASADFAPEIPWAGISITNADYYDGHELVEITSKNRVDLLRIGFDDIEFEHSDLITFKSEHAQLIWAFVDQVWSKIDLLMVHCHAGLSRSAAVAKAVSKKYQPEFFPYFDQLYVPNPLVYNLMIETRACTKLL